MEVEGDNNNNETTTDDDPEVLWKRCEESQRKRMQLMGEEKEKLQKEIDTMNSLIAAAAAANISGDDIIEINAGGKIISALRSTLTSAPDTVLSYMFSGRWEKSLKRDSNGRVFIDGNSQLIEVIIDFLRMKKMENPSKPLQPPKIPEEKKEHFALLLNYYGLTDFFYPPLVFLPPDINNIDVVQPHDSGIDVTRSENKIQFSKENNADDDNFTFLAFKPPIGSSGEGSFWKVTIDAVSSDGDGLFLGIIGNLEASDCSCADLTSCGWTSGTGPYDGSCVVYINGMEQQGHDGWIGGGFTQNECLYFQLKSNKLTMFSVNKNKKFTIDVATTVDTYYIHFNMYCSGTKITLEPLNEEERSCLL